MSWYWIISLIVFYIVMWTITAVVVSRLTECDIRENCVIIGIFWPIVLLWVPILVIAFFIGNIVEKYGYKEEE